MQNDDLTTIHQDNSIKVWDWETKSLKYNLKGHSNQVWRLFELINGNLLSADIYSDIILWK